MRWVHATAFLPLLAVGDKLPIKISFNEKLEGRIGVKKVAEEVVDKLAIDAKVIKSGDKLQNDTEALSSRDLPVSPADLVGAANELEGRQGSYCDPGYWYCSSFGRCCPRSYNCCSYGYCIDPDDACCPNGPCRAGNTCCGNNNCMEIGAQCCRDGSHCPKGNNCYGGDYGTICCTDSACTAHVDEQGSTTYASTRTTTRDITTTFRQYYYYTYYWSYTYYYWTYSYRIEASIVTYSLTTETTTLSVYTTDSRAASSYFETVTETIDIDPPASATSLSSLAGSTRYDSTSSSSSSSSDDDFGSSEPTGLGDSGGDNDDGPPTSGDDVEDSGARDRRGLLDMNMVLFLTLGAGIGAVAVAL